jgi:Flp pilus assembly protein TadD
MRSSFRACLALCVLTLLTAGCDRFMSDESRLARAEKSAAAGNYSAAATDVNQVLQANPGNVAARLRLAELEMQLGDARGAEFELKKALEQHASPVDTAQLRADIALALGHADVLLAWIDAADNPVAEPLRMLIRGRALLALKRFGDAQAQFERVLASTPDSKPALTGDAEALASQSRFDDALEQLARVVQGDAVVADARLLQARIFISRGQYAQAEQSLSRARQLAGGGISLPMQVSILLALTEAQLAQGRVDEAAKSAAALGELAPNTIPARLTSARVALARGEYVTGTAELQRLVSAAPDLMQLRMMLGAAHFAQGNYMQAANQLEQVVQQSPDNVEARKLLARVELQMDRPDAALRTLSPALETASTDTQLYALAGEANIRNGAPDRALEALERNAKARPTDSSAKLDLATAYVRAQRYDAAVPLLRGIPRQENSARREALLLVALVASQGPVVARRELDALLQQSPKDVQLRYLSAAYFITRQEFERAKAEIDVVLKSSPADTRALVILAKIEFANGKRQPAEAALQAALKAEPANAAVRLMLAQLYLANANLALARSTLDAAIAAAPGKADVVHSSGLLLADAGLVDEALARFRRAVDLEPGNAVYWLSVARAQAALEQSSAARESVNKALALRPDWIAAESLLAMLDLRASGPAAALARAVALRARWHDDPMPMILEGDIQMYARHYSEAAKAYADAARITQSSTLVMKQFEAVRLANQERPEQLLERWLAVRPDDARARAMLAQYFSNLGRFDRAISEFQFLTQQLPNEAPLLNNLAWLYHLQRDARAEPLARRAHELAPSNASIADTYGWILLSANKLAEAVPLLKSASEASRDDPAVSYHYGAALAAAGRHDEARVALAAALKSASRFEGRRDAEKLLSQLDKRG